MAKIQIEIYDEITAPIVNSKRSKLGKRDIKGGVKIDFSKIPAAVLNDLLIDAVKAYLQVGLKTIDQDSATTEECQAAMKKRLSLLESGAVSAPGAARKAPTRDPIKAAAKAMVKKAIQDRTEEKLDGKVLTKMVSDLFKLHDAWVKAGSNAEAKEAKAANMVANAMKRAKAAQEESDAMGESLAGLAKKAAELSAAAAAKKAEATDEAEVEAEAPKAKATTTAKKGKPATR